MIRIALLAAALTGMTMIAACNEKRVEPAPTPTAPATFPVNEGGTCGDGRILRPGEQCP